MKRICILSDTHGLLRDEVKAEMAAADVILHAGDIGSDAVLAAMEQYPEVYAVRGNNDRDRANHLPLTLTVTIDGLRFFLVHNKRDIPKELSDIDVVVYGHSHKYEAVLTNGILYINPGSCGKRRFHLGLSLCRMIVNGRDYKIEKIVIGEDKDGQGDKG